jgi:tetratricopeptide (TPR) repeat protein
MPRDLRRSLIAAAAAGGLAMVLVAWALTSGRSTAPRPAAGMTAISSYAVPNGTPGAAPVPGTSTAPGPTASPVTSPPPPGPLAARTEAASLLANAAAARRQGDVRATLSLLRAAVERAPSVETHAARGALLLDLAIPDAAATDLRAAADGDPDNAERWIALANALALKPDPMAAAAALERARAAEPGLRVRHDAGGWLVRDSVQPAP